MFICALLVSVGTKAQTTQPAMRSHGMKGARMQQILKDSLHLTDMQIDSVKIIREQTTGTIMAIRNDTTFSQEQRQEQMKAAKEQMKNRMKSVLSKEQMQKLEVLQRSMRKNRGKNESSQ